MIKQLKQCGLIKALDPKQFVWCRIMCFTD